MLSAESLGFFTKNEQYHRIHLTLLKAGMKLFAHLRLCAKKLFSYKCKQIKLTREWYNIYLDLLNEIKLLKKTFAIHIAQSTCLVVYEARARNFFIFYFQVAKNVRHTGMCV